MVADTDRHNKTGSQSGNCDTDALEELSSLK